MLRKHFVCHDICKQFDTNQFFNTWFSFFLGSTFLEKTFLDKILDKVNLIKIFPIGQNRYGKCSIIANAVDSWNITEKQLKNILLKDYPPIILKTDVSNFLS